MNCYKLTLPRSRTEHGTYHVPHSCTSLPTPWLDPSNKRRQDTDNCTAASSDDFEW